VVVEEGFLQIMERYRTIRAYSAGGVVFRLVPINLTGQSWPQGFSFPGWQTQQQTGSLLGLDTAPGCSPDRHTEDGYEVQQPDTSVEVALVGRSNAGIWALPKGTPQAGETVEQVASREVQEETGLQVRLICYVGSISYSFVREQVRYYKQVRHFLFEAVGGDVALHDHEYDLVEWFPLPEASRHLTYQNEVNILYQAEDVLQRWLAHQQQKEGLK
jgi:8-oxo-dGTP pyrophosphatase MutT (NUDIX family)